jgi:hypothetical protein
MESEVETFRAWFAYFADTRRDYLETIAKLPPAELTRDRGPRTLLFSTFSRTLRVRNIAG